MTVFVEPAFRHETRATVLMSGAIDRRDRVRAFECPRFIVRARRGIILHGVVHLFGVLSCLSATACIVLKDGGRNGDTTDASVPADGARGVEDGSESESELPEGGRLDAVDVPADAAKDPPLRDEGSENADIAAYDADVFSGDMVDASNDRSIDGGPDLQDVASEAVGSQDGPSDVPFDESDDSPDDAYESGESDIAVDQGRSGPGTPDVCIPNCPKLGDFRCQSAPDAGDAAIPRNVQVCSLARGCLEWLDTARCNDNEICCSGACRSRESTVSCENRANNFLVHNSTSGALEAWFMSGAERTGWGSLVDQTVPGPVVVPEPWYVGAVGHFNRDDTGDLVWQDVSTGALQIWIMKGTERVAWVTPTDYPTGSRLDAGSSWRLSGSADFNRDGDTDLIFYDTQSGQLQVWFMNATVRRSYATIKDQATTREIAVEPPWRLGAVGDFDADQQPDMVFQNTMTGDLQIWFMSATDRVDLKSVKDQATQAVLQAPSPWSLRKTAHINTDGRTDLVFHNSSSGEIQVWFMNGTDRNALATVKDQATGSILSAPSPWVLAGD